MIHSLQRRWLAEWFQRDWLMDKLQETDSLTAERLIIELTVGWSTHYWDIGWLNDFGETDGQIARDLINWWRLVVMKSLPSRTSRSWSHCCQGHPGNDVTVVKGIPVMKSLLSRTYRSWSHCCQGHSGHEVTAVKDIQGTKSLLSRTSREWSHCCQGHPGNKVTAVKDIQVMMSLLSRTSQSWSHCCQGHPGHKVTVVKGIPVMKSVLQGHPGHEVNASRAFQSWSHCCQECVSGRFGWTIAVRFSNRLSDCWWNGCSETDWSIVRVINCKEIDWLIAGREETFAVGAECW